MSEDTRHFGEIADLCNRVYRFQAARNWRFKALPVICWEFADIGEYLHAMEMLGRAVSETMRFAGADVRFPDRSTAELDVCGVTFRLSCQAIYDTPEGPKGVNEMKFVRREGDMNNTPPNPGIK